MTLRNKFSMLILWIGVQTVILALALLFAFNWLVGLKNYQYELANTQYVYKSVSAFTDSISAKGIEMDTMATEWASLMESCAENFDELLSDPIRKRIHDEYLTELTDSIENLWNTVHPQLGMLTAHYNNLSSANVSEMFKNTVRTSGFSQAITNYNDTEDLTDIVTSMSQIREQVSVIYYTNESLNQVVNELSEGLSDMVENNSSKLYIAAVVISILSAIIVVLIVRRTTSILILRISKIQRLASKLASKDLTARTYSREKDEIGELIDNLNGSFSDLNGFFNVVKNSSIQSENAGQTINRYARTVSKATDIINSHIETLNSQFEKLHGAVERSVSSIDNMNAVSKVLVENNHAQSAAIAESHAAVSNIANTLEEISIMAEEKTQSAIEMQDFVADGDSKVSATNNLLAQITSQLDEVSEVVTIINDIAEQTNLLSMNAAIESAHAGEAGKGFGVVAEEIRSLADSTGENAKRISSSIYTIIDKVREANSTSNTAAEAFTKVSLGAKDMLVALSEISSGIKDIDSKTEQLFEKTNEISESATKINTYSNQLSDQQSVVSSEINTMKNIFEQSAIGIADIREGTADIVNRMKQVTVLSNENCQKMVELGCQLDEFKTSKVRTKKPKDDDLSTLILTKPKDFESHSDSESDGDSESNDDSAAESQTDSKAESDEEMVENPAETAENAQQAELAEAQDADSEEAEPVENL